MTNKRIRFRYEVNCSKEDVELIKQLAKLEGKKRNKMIIDLVKRRLEELKENR